MAYHHIKSLILDRPLYLWNKDNSRRLFLEVDSSDDGWDACVYQYEETFIDDKEAGKLSIFSKRPKRIIAWVSKVLTNYEKASLPIFYKETIARLLTFEHFRNLIETQQPGCKYTGCMVSASMEEPYGSPIGGQSLTPG